MDYGEGSERGSSVDRLVEDSRLSVDDLSADGLPAGHPGAVPPTNITSSLSQMSIRFPRGAALVDLSDKIWTWSELDRAVDARVNGFLSLGIGRGDRLAIELPTSAELVISLLGACRMGAVAVPFSPTISDAERDFLLTHSGARLLLTDRTSGSAPAGVQIIDPGSVSLSEKENPAPEYGNGEELALLSYTSGTTGPPRGVMLSHRALLANVEQLGAVQPAMLRSADRVLIAAPLFHVYGFGPGLLHSFASGASVVLAPDPSVRENSARDSSARESSAHSTTADEILRRCAKHRVTVIVSVPALYREMSDFSSSELGQAFATVRRMISGAAPLPRSVFLRIRRAIGLEVHEGYGLTEAAPVVTSTLVTGRPKPGSVGAPLPGIELRLVESDGAEQVDVDSAPTGFGELDDAFVEESGGTGLIAIRGSNLFSGYWPDGSRGPDAEGWFRTGDVGYLDADGDLHLVDRANDLITVEGFTVFPHEVEEVIAQLPGVGEVAVIGVPQDDASGEWVKAVITREKVDPARESNLVTEDGLSEDEVISYCADRLASYKVPRSVEFVNALPHSATGKLRRVSLRD
jgi:long-chain acyl-CoA synthetase